MLVKLTLAFSTYTKAVHILRLVRLTKTQNKINKHLTKRGQIYEIAKVDSYVSPALFFLKDLMKDNVEGSYYREQLVKSEKPDYKSNFFEVESILGTKKVKGKKYFLVKFLYYPSKFNQYVPSENLK
jgi:hypothetical protein